MTFGSDWNFSVVLVHLHKSAWALSWERRAPARLQKPRWSVALPAKALTQQVLRKCTRMHPMVDGISVERKPFLAGLPPSPFPKLSPQGTLSYKGRLLG